MHMPAGGERCPRGHADRTGRIGVAEPGAAFGEPLFKKRIETIMKKKTQHQTTNPVRAAVLLIGITALPLSATFADEAKARTWLHER